MTGLLSGLLSIFVSLAFSSWVMAEPALASAVLPASRSVLVGSTATAFATVINTGSSPALSVSIATSPTVPAGFRYQTTDPLTNQITGTPDTPVDIPAGESQSFLIAVTPTAALLPTELELNFTSRNADPAPILSGINTLLLSASPTPVPDIVALAATPSQDGIVSIPGVPGAAAFSVASVNLGAGEVITATADTGGGSALVILSLCETNSATGECLSSIAGSVTRPIDPGATPTFSVFVTATGGITFAPADNRIFVRFRDAGGVIRGATSVAVRTE